MADLRAAFAALECASTEEDAAIALNAVAAAAAAVQAGMARR